MKFCLAALALGASALRTQVPACSGTDEVSSSSEDPWTCDKFGEDSEECVKHFQKHETGHFQCVLRAAGVGTSNCLTGHRCVVAELDAVGRGHCEEGQIYASAAWELAPSSGGLKGFKTAEYKGWVKDAWAKCLVKNPQTKFISVWTDAGYRCYTAASCKPNSIKGIKSFTTSVDLNSIGKGHCEGGQIYASKAWELGPKKKGKKGFTTRTYKRWVKAAWRKCQEKDPNTKFISVWTDAGYRCYSAASCTPNGFSGITSFTTA